MYFLILIQIQIEYALSEGGVKRLRNRRACVKKAITESEGSKEVSRGRIVGSRTSLIELLDDHSIKVYDYGHS